MAGAERLEVWAPRMEQAFAQLDRAVRSQLQLLAEVGEEDAKTRAPKDRGRLAYSIKGEVLPSPNGYAITLTASAPYARIQEEGGTITGRPWLTIPLRPDVRAMGSARADGNLFVIKTRDGRLFLASRQGGGLDVRWRLARSVTIRAQPYLRPAMATIERRLPAALGRAVAIVTGQAGPPGAGGGR